MVTSVLRPLTCQLIAGSRLLVQPTWTEDRMLLHTQILILMSIPTATRHLLILHTVNTFTNKTHTTTLLMIQRHHHLLTVGILAVYHLRTTLQMMQHHHHLLTVAILAVYRLPINHICNSLKQWYFPFNFIVSYCLS